MNYQGQSQLLEFESHFEFYNLDRRTWIGFRIWQVLYKKKISASEQWILHTRLKQTYPRAFWTQGNVSGGSAWIGQLSCPLRDFFLYHDSHHPTIQRFGLRKLGAQLESYVGGTSIGHGLHQPHYSRSRVNPNLFMVSIIELISSAWIHIQFCTIILLENNY